MSQRKRIRKTSPPAGKGSTDKPTASSASPMDLTVLEQLVQLMSSNDLNTVDLRDGDKRIILQRGGSYMPSPAPAAMVMSPPSQSIPSSPPPALPASDESNAIPIKSPMVGTFYAASGKGAKPFVSVGSAVDEETDVCIVEAMKVFNNIKAECRGTITKILVQDSQPVEFGQVMFLVKPS